MKNTIYDRVGGEGAVNAAVEVFYRKVLADDRIRQFFEGVDMEKQAAKQKAFLTMALGGPNNYTGEDMRKGHAHLVANGLNGTHFDAVVENLGATLTELGVTNDLITEAAAIVESTRADVLAGFTEEEGNAMTPSLFDRIGGDTIVTPAIEIFGRKLLSDKRLNAFFEGVDITNESEMTRLAGKLKAFLTMAMGGPHNYTGEDMRSAHAHLVKQGLNDSHFDAVLELIGETLAELDVSEDLIAEATAVAETSRNDVLGK